MKLLTWNVNGIRGMHGKGIFKDILAQDADVYCFQETKSELSQLPDDLKTVDGFHVFYSHAKNKKGYSGTAIFTREKPLDVLYDFPHDLAKKYKLEGDGYGNPNEEGRVLAVELKECFVVNVYTPNSKPDLSRLPLRHGMWDPAFLEYCKLLEKRKPVIFCGDLNVAHTADDLANPKSNEFAHGFTKEEREGVDNIVKAGFVDAFRLFTQGNGRYTWWSHFARARDRNVGWRIDYFFVSKKLAKKVSSCAILDNIYGSDHCPVVLDIDL